MNDKADWKERPELGCAAGENGFEKKTDIDRVSGRNGSAVKETGFERQAERSGMPGKAGSAAKTAVITGGTRGIGRACVRAFAEAGYRIAVIYRSSAAEAEKLRQELRDGGTDCEVYRCDVASRQETEAVCASIQRRFGHADVLVNNAGIAEIKLFTDISEADWDRMFDVNVKGAFHFCSCLAPDMISRKSGSIINISSMWGITGASCEVHYSASKATLIGFTKALAKELGLSGIRVNCVAPGVIDTDMNRGLDEETKSCLREEIPLARIGRAEEVARTVLFLAGEGASYITGQVISADGGMVI